MLGAKAERTHAGNRTHGIRRKRPTGTPRPRTFQRVAAGLLARGSSLPSRLPEILAISVTSMDVGSPLTVAGAAPALPASAPDSLLAPAPTNGPENHEHIQCDFRAATSQEIVRVLHCRGRMGGRSDCVTESLPFCPRGRFEVDRGINAETLSRRLGAPDKDAKDVRDATRRRKMEIGSFSSLTRPRLRQHF